MKEGYLHGSKHDVFDLEEKVSYLVGSALCDADEFPKQIAHGVQIKVLSDVVGCAQEHNQLEPGQEDEVEEPIHTRKRKSHNRPCDNQYLLHKWKIVLKSLVVVLCVEVAGVAFDGFWE